MISRTMRSEAATGWASQAKQANIRLLVLVAIFAAGCSAAASPSHDNGPLAAARNRDGDGQRRARPGRGRRRGCGDADQRFRLRPPAPPGSKGNLVASPASIALALGMVRPGANGLTATEMDKVLHSFGADGQANEIGALLETLARKTSTWTTAPVQPPTSAGHDRPSSWTSPTRRSSSGPTSRPPISTRSAPASTPASASLTTSATLKRPGFSSTRGRGPDEGPDPEHPQPGRRRHPDSACARERDLSQGRLGERIRPQADRRSTVHAADGKAKKVPTMAIESHFEYARVPATRPSSCPTNGMAMTSSSRTIWPRSWRT